MAKKIPLSTKLWVSGLLLLGLLVVGTIIAAVLSSDDSLDANTAVIRVTGPIVSSSPDGIFSDGYTVSLDVVERLRQARDDPTITGIILEINSPGGSPVATDEIARAVHDARAEKPVVAWIREVGASGAYWVASATDHVIANRMSVTGSIGAIGSYFGFSEFLDEWNVTYYRLVAGENKDIGDPFQPMSYTDRVFLQEKLDAVHMIFIEAVASNRNMTVEELTPLADGRYFLGYEALEVGLVDELGGEEEAWAFIQNKTGEQVVTVILEDQPGLLAEMLGVYRGSTGRLDVDIPVRPYT